MASFIISFELVFYRIRNSAILIFSVVANRFSNCPIIIIQSIYLDYPELFLGLVYTIGGAFLIYSILPSNLILRLRFYELFGAYRIVSYTILLTP